MRCWTASGAAPRNGKQGEPVRLDDNPEVFKYPLDVYRKQSRRSPNTTVTGAAQIVDGLRPIDAVTNISLRLLPRRRPTRSGGCQMKPFTFQAPPNILFEAGASKKLAELVAGYGAKRVLLVTDKGVRNAGLTKNAEAGLVADGCELTVFDEVEADPPSHVIERAVALCRDKEIELVASIGGGSALDTAKLVAYLAKPLTASTISMASALPRANAFRCCWRRRRPEPVRR